MDVLLSLKEISKTLNEGRNVPAMLQTALSKLLAITDLTSGWIFLIDKNGRHSLAANHNVPPALAREGCSPLKDGGCWCKNKFMKKELNQAVNVIECQRIEKAIEQNWGDTLQITHHATIPILAGEQPIGILNVAKPGKLHFDSQELNLLETIGYQIGTAINRVQLYEQEHNRVQELNQLSVFLQELHTLTTDASDDQLVEEIKKSFSFKDVSLQYLDSHIPMLTFGNRNECSSELHTQLTSHIYLFKERQRLLRLADELTRGEERQQLARDLHDSVNQLLFTLQLRLKGLSFRVDQIEVKKELTNLGVVVQEALKELKTIIQCRRAIDDVPSLSESIKQYANLIGLRVKLVEGHQVIFTKEEQEHLYRLIQEAMNNTKKHAHRDEISITIQHNKIAKVILIEDTGVGFDLDKNARLATLGITSIRARAGKLGGHARLTSSTGDGTKWEVTIPILKEGV
ncbi:GAF domain-containing sensor histidine kinase [Alkalicoccobacillus porphyridii]|uniref:histidine kinase n=1 Tax=Alkalicoccobacillus porphyridii TaxID=2597270 RepID=A0A554A1T2_9BACI|nr:GAF domain-containing protein [Alkalicoccobacillus porphyridii]TSB47645.1 GAF domain-containing protein [Alkalicoccobacillus porphyridii]